LVAVLEVPIMSTASVAPACPFCTGPLADDRQPCPQCHASPGWIDMGQALEFALRRFEEWHKQGRIGAGNFRAISDFYAQQREVCSRKAREGQPVPENAALLARTHCWSCNAVSDPRPEFCAECGAPWDVPAVRSLRFWTFLGCEINRQSDAGRLALNVTHDLKAEVRERRSALLQKLEQQRVPAVTAAPQDATRVTRRRPRSAEQEALPVEPIEPRRSVWEILLDPRTIQWLLCFGGALFVIGLVIWLAAIGFFNKWTVAVVLGVANAAVLFGGWAIITRTRYQTAGRALTLLACLVMPLNLWFYDAKEILQFGEHLWVPALVCCVLYAASALVLRDHLFVPVLLGGIALTGLLILGDMHKFWEIAPPSALLVILGLIALHLERAFPEGDGPFSRNRFGMAFYWSAQALLGGGLLLLLGGQIAGWLYEPFVNPLHVASAPYIVSDPGAQLLAIVLVLAGTYAYVYSDLVVRRVGVYMYLAVFTLLWAEVLIVLQLHLNLAVEAVIAILAGTALLLNLLQVTAGRTSQTLARAMPPLGIALAVLPVALGVWLHVAATNKDFPWSYTITWSYVGAMLLTAVTCRVGAYVCRHTMPWVSTVYFFGTAAATLVGAAALLHLLGVQSWDRQAAIIMVVPILYLIASRLYRGHTAEQPLVWAAHVATGFLIAGVFSASLDITPQVWGPKSADELNLWRALFCAEAAVFYALATGLRKQGWTIYPATVLACGAIWQLFRYWGITAPEYYILVFAALGFLLLLVYRLALLERFEQGGLAPAAFGSANALMSLALVAGALLALWSILVKLNDPSASLHSRVVFVLLVLSALSLLAAGLVRHPAWRPWYIVMSIAEALLMFVTLEVLSDLSLWEKVEIFSIVVGVLLLLLGHWGWFREQAPDLARQSELVSLGLFFGSVLTALPLAIAVLIHRGMYHGRPHEYSWPNEMGMLIAGVLLLGTGFMLRLKSTTIAGGALLAVYVLTLIMFIHDLDNIAAAALGIVIGGGVVFGVGLLLSVYRDRLLMLPERIKRREGIFRVLSWR
jgi:hypothetical protein